MMTQESLLIRIFVLINKIQMNKEARDQIQKDPIRKPILDLRERLIEIINELKSLYRLRQYRIDMNFSLLDLEEKEENLIDEANEAYKKMCHLNSDIVVVTKEDK